MGLGAQSLLSLVCAGLVFLHPVHHPEAPHSSDPPRTLLASPSEAAEKYGKKTPAHCDCAYSFGSSSASCCSTTLSPRLSPSSVGLPPLGACTYATVGVPVRLSKPRTRRVVQSVPETLHSGDLALPEEIKIQEYQGEEGDQERRRTSTIRTCGTLRTLEQVDPTENLANSSSGERCGQGNCQGTSCCSRNPELRRHGGIAAAQGEVQRPTPSCILGGLREVHCQECAEWSEADPCLAQQGKHCSQCLSEKPRTSFAAGLSVESLHRAPSDKLFQAAREVHHPTARSHRGGEDQTATLGRSPIGDQGNHSARWKPSGIGQHRDGTRYGSLGHYALGQRDRARLARRASRSWPRGTSTFPEEDGIPARQAAEARGWRQRGNLSDYLNLGALFEVTAAQVKRGSFVTVIWIVGFASFHFRACRRIGASCSLASSYYLNLVMVALSIFQVHAQGIPAILGEGLFGNGGAWNLFVDAVFFMLAGSGYLLEIVIGINDYFMRFFKGIFMGFRQFWQLFWSLRRRRTPTVQSRRFSKRGRLILPVLSLTGFNLLGICVSAEIRHSAHLCSEAYSPFSEKFFTQCSGDVPCQPPEVPEGFEELSGASASPDLMEFEPEVILMYARDVVDAGHFANATTDDTEPQRPTNIAMFGYHGEPVGRRDASVTDFHDETIRAAVRAAWRDFEGPFELYPVEPQPDKLAGQGWITVLYIRGHQRPLLPGVLVLKEVTTYRHTWAFPSPAPEHEAFFVSARPSFQQLIQEAGLQDRCNEQRYGSCTLLLRGSVVLRGGLIRILNGDLLCFLVDEAWPAPPDVVQLADEVQFQENYAQTLGTTAPRQYLTVYTHGFHGGFVGTRSYGAFRPSLLEFETFSRQMLALWQDEVFRHIRVHCVIPQPARVESSGEIEMHYILNFGTLASNLVLLRHDPLTAPSNYQVVATEAWATPHQLLSLAGWERLHDTMLPDIFWGSSQLAIDDVLQMRTGMILVFTQAPDQDDSTREDDFVLLQTWYEFDHLHGRTVGMNGFRQLPPPGNGTKVSFANHVWIVEEHETTVYQCIKDNPFLDELYEDLRPDEELPPNSFQSEFRFWSDKITPSAMADDDFSLGLYKQIASEAFRNPFVNGFIFPCHEACDKGDAHTIEDRDLSYDELSEVNETVENFSGPPPVLQLAECISDLGVPLTTTHASSDGITGVDFRKVIDTLLWFDAHVTTPCYVEPAEIQWHESSLSWLALDWWLNEPVREMHFYTDGSQRAEGGGLACALFVMTLDGRWKFGGYKAVKTKLHGSYAAELSALLVTFKWIYDVGRFQVALPEHVEVHFDSTSAGFRATGHWQGSTYTSTVTCLRALTYLIDERFRCSVDGLHVKAHCGNGGNEMANSLAYWAAYHATEEIDTCLHSCCEGHLDLELEWMFYLFKTELAPFWSEGHLQLPTLPSTKPSLDSDLSGWDIIPGSSAGHECRVNMKVTSANVLTLLPGQDTEAGLLDSARQATILRQAKDAGVHILSLQETRLRKSTFRSTQDFWVIQSAAHKGHGGIALCFSRKIPYGTQIEGQGRELFFKKEHFVIVASDPRWLIVRVKAPGFRCLVLGLHAPQSGQQEAAIRLWWDSLAKAIPKRYSDWQLIAAGDFNARCGPTPTAATGGFQGENENLNGELMQGWLICHGMWAPATFSCCQEGPPGTWQHPGTGRWSRLDYICLTSSMFCTRAWVDLSFDLALRRTDHLAVTAEISFQSQETDTGIHYWNLRPPDNGVLQTHLENMTKFCCQIHPGVDVHTHTLELTERLHKVCALPDCDDSKGPRKSAMSSATWSLVKQKRAARNNLFWWQMNQRLGQLRELFNAWKRHSPGDDVPFDNKFHDYQIAHFWGLFRELGRQVTRAVRSDTKTFFETLAQTAGELDDGRFSKSFWQEIRKHFPKMKKRRIGFAPLQIEELEDQWIPHFAALESGMTVDPDTHLQKCFARQCDNQKYLQVHRSIEELPSIIEVEGALRKTKPNKACGPEKILPEYLHFGAPRIASAVHSLFVKIFLSCAEPLWFKGGTMLPIHKRSSFADVNNFRGIMLLPSLAKSMQAILRSRLVAKLASVKPPGLLGGFPRQRVTFGSHCVSTFSSIAATYGFSTAILYIDMKQAYHCLVRVLSLGLGKFQQDFEATVNGLPDQAMKDGCRQALLQGCPIETLFAGSPLLDLLQEVHIDTFFLMQKKWVRTARGSRPGSPLADMAFAGLMCKLHKRLDEILHEDPELKQTTAAMKTQAYTLTWADYVTLELASSTAAQLIPLVQRISQAAFDLFTSHGLTLNLSAGKTSAVLSLRGQGAPALRKEWLPKHAKLILLLDR